MNVKSKFDTEEEDGKRPGQYIRGGCGLPYSMLAEPTRVDVSSLHAPSFIEKIFRMMGWKTDKAKSLD